jgi:uncharacterized 2Fe-2S/4Fe-4S cluster protein (DUF4445 family)
MNPGSPHLPTEPPSSVSRNTGDQVRIELWPSGKVLRVPRGQPLQDLLFAQGVEFPCGGHGRCKGCRIRVLEGHLGAQEDDRRLLRAEELAAGWRLSCRGRAEGDLKINLADWETPILADGSAVPFTPREGLGVAVDLGTTTVVAQLVDLRTGQIQSVSSAWNAQAVLGADIMSRIERAVHGGLGRLTELIRGQLASLIRELFVGTGASPADLQEVLIVGNTVMHHLFGGLDVGLLAQHPFAPVEDGEQRFTAGDLGWVRSDLWEGLGTLLHQDLPVRFLPCLGGFVGSDVLAGVLATGLHEGEEPAALIDLGTNGELVVGDRHRLLCASTAAGPAFEGARISMGMRAATGAIAAVDVREGKLECRVLGRGAPRGVCGSGLVDAVAAGLELGVLLPNGRMAGGNIFALAQAVHLTQGDIRELQLAKGAIAAGLRLLARRWGTEAERLSQVYVAGAFGNYIDLASARRIGLLPFQAAQVVPVGNAALRGARLALLGGAAQAEACRRIRSILEHVSLSDIPEFQDVFAGEMRFPSSAAD